MSPPCAGHVFDNHPGILRGFAVWRRRKSEDSRVLEDIAWGEAVISITEAFLSRNKYF